MEPTTAIRDLARVAACKHPNDIPAAVDMLRAKATKAKYWPDLRSRIEREWLQGLIYQVRGERNAAIKQAAVRRMAAPVPTLSAFEENTSHYDLVLMDLMIAGRRLGDLLGRELPDIVASAKNRVRGEMRVIGLAESLIGKVPEDSSVDASVTEEHLQRVWSDQEAVG